MHSGKLLLSGRIFQNIFRSTLFCCCLFVKSLTAKMIPPSVIPPLPKKDTDPLECPVSLLSTDVKILAKVLARHLETVAPEMISPDQTVFIKSCYLFSTIRHLFNILYNLPHPLVWTVSGTFTRTWKSVWSGRVGLRIKYVFKFDLKFEILNYFQLQWGMRQGFICHCNSATCNRQSSVIKGSMQITCCFISDPCLSAPKLLIIRLKFGEILGYKVNIQNLCIRGTYCI